ncbi:MAG: hypothetical protein WCS52_07030 [bacterium]
MRPVLQTIAFTEKKLLCAILGLLLAMATFAGAAEAKPKVVLGLGSGDAAKYNVEFMRFDRRIPLFTENNIQASLFDASGLCRENWTEEQLYQTFRKYHVIAFGTSPEGVYKLDDQFLKRAEVVGKALMRYVQEGGGLFVQPQPVRYPGGDDEKYWNLVLAPFGLEILHEGLFDKTRAFEGKTIGKATFWFTRNILPHPVTEGVSGLCLPLHGQVPAAGLVAMKYAPEWQVIVRGEKEAKSYQVDLSRGENGINIGKEGSCASEPPVLAVRTFGKGRVVCYPLSPIFAGNNYGNPLWSQIVESKGDPDASRPSQGMKLQMNAYRWLAASALAIPEFGTYRPDPYQPVTFPASIDWSKGKFAAMTPDKLAALSTEYAAMKRVRAVVGAHTAYSDGKGTVAQYVAAAKAAGVQVLVFADPLEKLTGETLAKLKADCAEASKAGDFYACPGIEFTDGIGNRWAFWGEKLVFPDASFKDRTRTYVQWDGKKVNLYGQYNIACGFTGSALLDYQQLRKNGAHPENLWWFFHYLPLVYDHGNLIADNYADFLFGLRDMRSAVVSSFTRITDPSEVAAAASLCYTGFNSLDNAREALNTRCGAEDKARAAGQFVSQGPSVLMWFSPNDNSQMEANWKYIRGAQRVRLCFAVRSDQGIAEVKVHDADCGTIRRFLGHGEKLLEREFELVHDQQHYLTLEVIDTAGQRAFSSLIKMFCYKSGLYRCGDNLNILGPTAMCWIPDRNEFFPAAKDFRNGDDYSLTGWDTSSLGLGVPQPWAQLNDLITFKEAGGEYPHPSKLNAIPSRLMDVGINNYNLQIATMRMTHLSERFETAQRPTPSAATVPRDVGDLEFYDRTHTIFAPMEREDMFVSWNYRRSKEGRKDYKGGIIWHEGEYRFKKDVTLQGTLPIPLFDARCPTDLARNIGTMFIVTDADGVTKISAVRDEKKPERMMGRIRPGGYAAYMTTPVGYLGLLVPADMDFAYEARFPATEGFKAGLGRDGQVIKAGTVLKYRFGVGTFADDKFDNALLEHTIKALNFGGGQAGYPVEMKVGECKDAVFFFTAAAKKGEALFSLGPQALIIDLPVRVQGIENNGCVAVYSTKCPWFRFIPVDAAGTAWLTEPIDQKNEMWVGNVFTCDRKEVKLTLVVDGQAEGQKPFIELHNPTDKDIETTVRSPAHAPLFCGMTGTVKIPAGESVRLQIDGKSFQPLNQ